MKKVVILLPLLLAFSVGFVFTGNNEKAHGLEEMSEITAPLAKQYLYALASDSLEGRETGYPGQRRAAVYLAQLFTSFGLKPIGDSGTYFQHYPLVHSRIDSSSLLVARTGATSRTWKDFGRDYLPISNSTDTVVTGPVVFAGYGISSTVLHYDEYDTTIDYRGKVVLVLRGGPGSDDSTTRFFRLRDALGSSAKRAYASKHGAAALLIVEDTHGHPFAETVEEHKDATVRGIVLPPSRRRTDLPTFAISRAIANELLAGSGTTVEALAARIDSAMRPATFVVPGSAATVELRTRTEVVEAQNVIGLLEGSDPALKNEYLFFSAHYDHLGRNAATGQTYYGADDNASGTTSVLAIADAFTKARMAPRRSIVFLIVSGEEKGLLGSTYYVEHPIIPLASTVADLNIDMVGRVDPPHASRHDSNYIYVIGSDKLSSELDAVSREADSESVAMSLDYTYDSDSDPNQFYRRSDHYNFAKHGIPVIFYFNGTHADYHQPSDRPEKIDLPLLARRAQLIFYTGLKIANAPHRPIVDRGAGTKNAGGSE